MGGGDVLGLELAAEIRDDLGLDRDNPATPAPPDGARLARIEAFAAKDDVDEASLLAVVADIKAEVDAIIEFIEAAKADQVDARVLFATMFKLFAVDLLRVRNPSAYALVRLAGVALDDEEFLQLLDAAALQQLVRGEGPAVDGEAWCSACRCSAASSWSCWPPCGARSTRRSTPSTAGIRIPRTKARRRRSRRGR